MQPGSITFSWRGTPDMLIEKKFDKSVMQYMGEQWHELSKPFMPYKHGELTYDVSISVSKNLIVDIVHNVHYAEYQYRGIAWQTGKPLKYKTRINSQATDHWYEAAKNAGKTEELLRNVRQYLRYK